MKKLIIVMLLVCSTGIYSQNSKQNRQAIKEKLFKYDGEFEMRDGSKEAFYELALFGRKIKSMTAYAMYKDYDNAALLILFKDGHYELIENIRDEIYKLQDISMSDKEEFFFAFIDTDNHLGRSDRK